MDKHYMKLEDKKIAVHSFNTLIVGSGASGLSAANRLYDAGQKDICIITEGFKMGTSRNTGSDKQTYYKMSLSGEDRDSVEEMAQTLYAGGSMDGDIALVEAALSLRSFNYLVESGVPFPHNEFGEYIGYKTDHDPYKRATSVGPLTSKYMTECLEQQVFNKCIQIFDGYQVIKVIKNAASNAVIGLLTIWLDKLDTHEKYVLFNCTNVVYATGGPSGMYLTSVYPESQTGASGIAFEAGVKGKNLTESQYGIASIKFRWNLSGTYQQVIPRYFSVTPEGTDEREFLDAFFETPTKLLDAIFLKGYQWPFDPRKVEGFGSSLIDLAVYYETVIKGRRVFLDYTKNPASANKANQFDYTLLGKESYEYLAQSGALLDTPIERLKVMNQPAVDLYLKNGIDLSCEYLEIAVCAQHNNGGLMGNKWWESNIKHFFPVGEVNGTHGVYRPGGSALNSGQVGAIRASQYICAHYKDNPLEVSRFIDEAKDQVISAIAIGDQFESNIGKDSNMLLIRREIGEIMSGCGAIVRCLKDVQEGKVRLQNQILKAVREQKLSSVYEIPYAFQNKDLVITAIAYLSAIEDYIQKGGMSRGSYLVLDFRGILPAECFPEYFRYLLAEEDPLVNKIQMTEYDPKSVSCDAEWVEVTPIPKRNQWFEKVWSDYRNHQNIV